ncbi:hypothetical protein C8F04DRAFT_1284554 [Mycena alexandri]|uniref:Beta-lactamase-related domain-containing protein n=1 Tax=Mycena alexandri TaxID=1745969 RepID=A0AAD6WP85_9AGAR|nr:hypothetical protein C8F04DRAFT_1284554 [Mycena alexandri]
MLSIAFWPMQSPVTTVDGPIYMHQAGTKLVDDPQSAAINEDTVFWLCSQTKLITTIAALQKGVE